MSPTHPPGPEPGGPLVVTTVGRTAVVSTEVLAHLEGLDRLRVELDDALLRIDTAVVAGGAPVESLRIPVRAAAADVATLCTGMRTAIAGYADAEHDAEAGLRRAAALVAYLAGAGMRALIPFLMGIAPIAGLGGLSWVRAFSDRTVLERLRDYLLEHPRLLTDPRLTRLVELLATSTDDFAAGLSGGLPPLLVQGAHDERTGEFGVEEGARSVIALGALLGMLRETPAHVERVGSYDLRSAARGATERLARVPEVNQIRIETYTAPGLPPRHVVYLGPTETFSPFADTETHDMTSNLHGVAGLSAASFRAVELAMHDAGIRPDDEVQLVGFSQGGLLATLVAASGDWNAVGLETYGAPAGNIELPAGLAGMAVRNTDDFIPALAGPQTDFNLLQVERRAFTETDAIPTDKAAPAHQRTGYVDAAQAIDADRSNVIREQVAAMDAFTADYLAIDGSTSTVTMYHAERGDAVPARGGGGGGRGR